MLNWSFRRWLAWAAILSIGVVCQGYTPRSWDTAKRLAEAIIGNLTLLEKIRLIHGKGNFNGRCVGNTFEIPRHTIPSFCFSDGPTGFRGVELTTAFPSGITVAATWDKRLMKARGEALGKEWRGKGSHIFLGPALDLIRAPAAGRIWESFGADPYLTGEAGYETIRGVQSQGVTACAKHLIGNQQEHYRLSGSSVIDPRTLHDLYWRPFQRAIEADVGCVMCSYNKLNGIHTCSDPGLIGNEGLLREGGFQGFLVSDWGSSHGEAHKIALAGMDVEMPGDWILVGGGIYNGLEAAVEEGRLPMLTIDKMAMHVLTPYFLLGQDEGFPETNFNINGPELNENVTVRSKSHTTLAREVAAAGTVLLKNYGNALPLQSSSIERMAIIGSDAAPNIERCLLNACLKGTLSVGWGSGTTSLEYLVAPLTAISDYVEAQGKTTQLQIETSDEVSKAVEAAIGADMALVFVAANSGEGTFQLVDWNLGDRKDLSLWHYGDDLIKAVAGVCNNTIVIIHTVGPVLMEEWIDHPNVTAVLLAGLPGEQSGPAIVDILWGAVNPSGRLPYTIAKSRKDYPAEVLYWSWSTSPSIKYVEGQHIDYHHFDKYQITPRFEFGFGLSYYFQVAYSDLQIHVVPSSSTLDQVPIRGGTSKDMGRREFDTAPEVVYSVTCTIRNIGARSGKEISQLYLSLPDSAQAPPQVLRGFAATFLEPGETKTVEFLLTRRDCSIWDENSRSWIRPRGIIGLKIGRSSRHTELLGSLPPY